MIRVLLCKPCCKDNMVFLTHTHNGDNYMNTICPSFCMVSVSAFGTILER